MLPYPKLLALCARQLVVQAGFLPQRDGGTWKSPHPLRHSYPCPGFGFLLRLRGSCRAAMRNRRLVVWT